MQMFLSSTNSHQWVRASLDFRKSTHEQTADENIIFRCQALLDDDFENWVNSITACLLVDRAATRTSGGKRIDFVFKAFASP